MELSIIKDKLHEYIDNADEKKLSAIYTILEEEIEQHYVYDDETLSMLYQRRTNHLNNTSESYSVEDSLAKIRNGVK